MSGRPGRGPAVALARTLMASARAADVTAAITDVTTRPWCSATFAGERCRMTLDASGERLAEWLDALPDADLPMRGYFVAEILATSVEDGEVTLESLVLEDL